MNVILGCQTDTLFYTTGATSWESSLTHRQTPPGLSCPGRPGGQSQVYTPTLPSPLPRLDSTFPMPYWPKGRRTGKRRT